MSKTLPSPEKEGGEKILLISHVSLSKKTNFNQSVDRMLNPRGFSVSLMELLARYRKWSRYGK